MSIVDAFLCKEIDDCNAWWKLDSGDMQNLFDTAVEELDEARARVKELEREVHKRDSTILNMKATIKDKEGWIDFENKENQKLEARVKELEREKRRAYEDGYKMGYGIAMTEKKAMESLIAEQATGGKG